jgi:hypothetical protein
MNRSRTIVAAALVAISTTSLCAQQLPKLLPFQGRLTDQNGTPVSDGARVVQFKIYDAPVGGRAVWNGEVQKLTVNGGLISTVLGTKAALSGVDFSQNIYLEITVDANGDDQIGLADPPLLPRQSILPALFAKFAADAGTLNGFSWSALFTGGNPSTGSLALGQDPSAIVNTDEGMFPPLDILGRPRIRQKPGGYDAGLWFRQSGPNSDRAFMGMNGDNAVGLYGVGGGWGISMDVNNGVVSVRDISLPLEHSISFGCYCSDSSCDSVQCVRMFTEYWDTPGIDAEHYRLVVEAPGELRVNAPKTEFTGCVKASNILCPSDRRLKTAIRKIDDPLHVVSQIGGVHYRFNKQAELVRHSTYSFPDGDQVGVLAQDVQQVLPSAVSEDTAGILSVNYNALTSVLIEAVKQQQRQIEELHAEVKDLREQIKR